MVRAEQQRQMPGAAREPSIRPRKRELGFKVFRVYRVQGLVFKVYRV